MIIISLIDNYSKNRSKKSFDKKEEFKNYGFSYKRGILLYGIPGGGKTSIINMLCSHLVNKMNGIVFQIVTRDELQRYANFISSIYRQIEPNRPIVTIFEDIDGLASIEEYETMLLNVLDGLNQVDNVVNIATTNYTEKLSERLLNRVNRFDRRMEIKSPNFECRELFFKAKLKPQDLLKINLEKWCHETEGMTMAQLGEVIKSVIILENSLEETISILKDMKQVPVSRNYNKETPNIGYKKDITKQEHTKKSY